MKYWLCRATLRSGLRFAVCTADRDYDAHPPVLSAVLFVDPRTAFVRLRGTSNTSSVILKY